MQKRSVRYGQRSEAVATLGASGLSVYPNFIPKGDQIISKTYIIRVEGKILAKDTIWHDLSQNALLFQVH